MKNHTALPQIDIGINIKWFVKHLFILEMQFLTYLRIYLIQEYQNQLMA